MDRGGQNAGWEGNPPVFKTGVKTFPPQSGWWAAPGLAGQNTLPSLPHNASLKDRVTKSCAGLRGIYWE